MKTILITGATSGVGLAAARALARQGHRLIVHGRSVESAAAAAREVAQATGAADVQSIAADLSDLHAVRRMADEVKTRFPRLDVLINNAAAMFAERRTSAQGFELNFAINVLAPYVLTESLLPLLHGSAPARVVNLSSVGYKSAKPDLDDLQAERGYKMQPVYFNSKLYMLDLTLHWARQHAGSGVTFNAVHPGGVQTGLARDFRGPMKWLFGLLMPLLFRTPDKGAETVVQLATSADVAEVNGEYFVDGKPEPLKPIGLDLPRQERLARECARLAGAAR